MARKLQAGLLSACFYAFYLSTGTIYSICTNWPSSSDFQGKFNKKGAIEEMKKEAKCLEEILKSKNDNLTERTILPVNIIVHESVKYFFDDADNPNDDDLWAKKVESALDGLRLYSEEGIGFEFKSVKTNSSEYGNSSFRAGYRLTPISKIFGEKTNAGELTMIFVPPVNPHLLGWGELGGTTSLIFITNSDYANQVVSAHEVGHNFGFVHAPASYFKEIIDPFAVFMQRNIMTSGDLRSGAKYGIGEQERNKLEIIHLLFEKKK